MFRLEVVVSALGKSACLSVVVERGRGSTTTNVLEFMKELLGVEEVLKILAVALKIAAKPSLNECVRI